jgi:glycerophosphoryl diester phosphodiesterase
MQQLLLLATALSFCFLIGCTTTRLKSTATMNFASNNVFAHRGAFKKNGFPENSIASLRQAIRLGCTGSEFDVRMTADEILVVNHDPHHGGMNIESSMYAQLRSHLLSNGEELPTLEAYLKAGIQANKATRLVLEIKPSPAGKERGQLYLQDVVGSIVRPVRELKAFEKIRLNPGESREVIFTLDPTALSFFNEKLELVAEPGLFHVYIGGNSQATQKASFTLL